jgi:hypothetical protein
MSNNSKKNTRSKRKSYSNAKGHRLPKREKKGRSQLPQAVLWSRLQGREEGAPRSYFSSGHFLESEESEEKEGANVQKQKISPNRDTWILTLAMRIW